MDSQEFLRALKHYSWIIILVSLFSVATTWAATFFLLQPIYKSDATILIKNRVMQEGQLIDESLLDEKYIKAFYNIAQSDTVAQNTIDELKLGWTLKYLRKIMNLEVDYYTGVIYIAVTTNDPELSQKLVNVFINNLEIQTGNNMRSVSINIIDAPKLPKGPIGPNLILNLILSLAGGVAAGILFAIMLASGRNKMFKPSVREKLDTLFCLGYLPKIKRKKNIDSIEIRDLSIGTVLANLDYLIKKNSIKTVLITSSVPGEGKTSVAISLALSLKQQSCRVLLVDFNTKRPGLYRYCKEQRALSDFDTSAYSGKHPLWVKTIKDLNIDMIMDHMIPRSRKHIDTSFLEFLLAEMVHHYDLIIIDGPPVLNDGNALMISKMVDGVLFISDYGKLTYNVLSESIKRLNQIQSNIIGIIFNRVSYRKIPDLNI